ncbi:mitochondrial ribosomal protein L32 [Carabus blaptoides fortunei]
MALSLIYRFRIAVQRLEYNIAALFGRRYPPEDLCIAGIETEIQPTYKKFSVQDILGDGFLWAVPRNRRTIERRWKRKFGHPEYVWKLLSPKTNLQVCNTCGHDHEIGVLCPHCYDKVQQETKSMQDAIQNELGLNPVEKEVIVLYDGEKQQQPEEFWEGKRIVEIKKERPSWFSKNLLQRTTQGPATTKDVKPSDLG